MSDKKVSFSIGDADEFVITKESKSSYNLPTFLMVGKQGHYNKENSFDLLEVIKQLSKNATVLLCTLIQQRDLSTNLSIIKAASLSKYERNKLVGSAKELIDHNIIKKVKREHYLINPKAVLPLPKEYQTVYNRYQEIK